jgi:hypothetical protein
MLTMEAYRTGSKWSPWRVLKPVVAYSHHFDEEQYSEKMNLD